MNDDNIQYLSQEKYNSIEVEIADLKQNKIPTIAKRIDEARQMGDLSENAEYHAARDEMAWAQTRVKELQYILSYAQVVYNTNSKTIQIGSLIVVSLQGKEKKYSIVGPQEADPLNGKISNESPLGNAFLGKKKGDKILVQLPLGPQEYKILEVK